MGKLIDDLIGKTQEFLQPNPGMLQLKLHIYSKSSAWHIHKFVWITFTWYFLTNWWNFIEKKNVVETSASRTKMMVVNNFSKVRGTTKNVSYPQPEGTLGEHMIKHGKDLGEEMMFGEWLSVLFGWMPPFGYDELQDMSTILIYVKREKYLAVIWSVSSRPICLIAVVQLSWLWQFLVFTYTLLVCQVL